MSHQFVEFFLLLSTEWFRIVSMNYGCSGLSVGLSEDAVTDAVGNIKWGTGSGSVCRIGLWLPDGGRIIQHDAIMRHVDLQRGFLQSTNLCGGPFKVSAHRKIGRM